MELYNILRWVFISLFLLGSLITLGVITATPFNDFKLAGYGAGVFIMGLGLLGLVSINILKNAEVLRED